MAYIPAATRPLRWAPRIMLVHVFPATGVLLRLLLCLRRGARVCGRNRSARPQRCLVQFIGGPWGTN